MVQGVTQRFIAEMTRNGIAVRHFAGPRLKRLDDGGSRRRNSDPERTFDSPHHGIDSAAISPATSTT
jgi:hypothetical protein